jgi:RimJ/RimL family protein N-acetyltransferase
MPQYHGRGIMTDAVNTVLHQWCIPRMNVRHMWVSTIMGNAGSVRVFEKNGFVLIKSREEHAAIKGTLRGLNILEWRVQS